MFHCVNWDMHPNSFLNKGIIIGWLMHRVLITIRKEVQVPVCCYDVGNIKLWYQLFLSVLAVVNFVMKYILNSLYNFLETSLWYITGFMMKSLFSLDLLETGMGYSWAFLWSIKRNITISKNLHVFLDKSSFFLLLLGNLLVNTKTDTCQVMWWSAVRFG